MGAAPNLLLREPLGFRPASRILPPPPLGWADARSTELMRRYQATRDEEAFAQLYGLNVERITRVVGSCLRFGAPDLDAEEIVGEVFASVFRSARCFRPEGTGAFRHWSAQIARNAVRRALRDRARRRSLETAELPEWIAASPASCAPAEPWGEMGEALALVYAATVAAFERLAPRDRDVLLHADLEESPYAEIAPRWKLRGATLRMVVFRARRRLFARAEKILAAARR